MVLNGLIHHPNRMSDRTCIEVARGGAKIYGIC